MSSGEKRGLFMISNGWLGFKEEMANIEEKSVNKFQKTIKDWNEKFMKNAKIKNWHSNLCSNYTCMCTCTRASERERERGGRKTAGNNESSMFMQKKHNNNVSENHAYKVKRNCAQCARVSLLFSSSSSLFLSLFYPTLWVYICVCAQTTSTCRTTCTLKLGFNGNDAPCCDWSPCKLTVDKRLKKTQVNKEFVTHTNDFEQSSFTCKVFLYAEKERERERERETEKHCLPVGDKFGCSQSKQ